MIGNTRIQKLSEIAKKNGYNQTKMAFKLGISVATWNRWIKEESFTRSQNTINQIDRFIALHK